MPILPLLMDPTLTNVDPTQSLPTLVSGSTSTLRGARRGSATKTRDSLVRPLAWTRQAATVRQVARVRLRHFHKLSNLNDTVILQNPLRCI